MTREEIIKKFNLFNRPTPYGDYPILSEIPYFPKIDYRIVKSPRYGHVHRGFTKVRLCRDGVWFVVDVAHECIAKFSNKDATQSIMERVTEIAWEAYHTYTPMYIESIDELQISEEERIKQAIYYDEWTSGFPIVKRPSVGMIPADRVHEAISKQLLTPYNDNNTQQHEI